MVKSEEETEVVERGVGETAEEEKVAVMTEAH